MGPSKALSETKTCDIFDWRFNSGSRPVNLFTAKTRTSIVKPFARNIFLGIVPVNALSFRLRRYSFKFEKDSGMGPVKLRPLSCKNVIIRRSPSSGGRVPPIPLLFRRLKVSSVENRPSSGGKVPLRLLPAFWGEEGENNRTLKVSESSCRFCENHEWIYSQERDGNSAWKILPHTPHRDLQISNLTGLVVPSKQNIPVKSVFHSQIGRSLKKFRLSDQFSPFVA